MEVCSSYRCAMPQHNAVQLFLGQNVIPTIQCSSAKQAHSRHCVTAATPKEVCSSHRCAMTQHNAVQLFLGQNVIPTIQCSSSKQAHSRHYVTAVSPMQFFSSDRCAVTQHKCSAALFRAKCNPHCSVLLCKTGSQQALCNCSKSYGVFLLIQVCSDPVQMQCNCSRQNA